LCIGVLLVSVLCATGQTLAQTATETTQHTFAASEGYTGGQVIQGADGNYYGVTAMAGSNGGVFRLSPSGVYTQLYTFSGGSDGALPAALLQGPDGNLYGVASTGSGSGCKSSQNYCGTIFELSPAGSFTVLHNFNDAIEPSSIILGADGNLYGTGTTANGLGVIFELALPSGVYSTLANSDFGPQTLVQGSDGNFYGMTQALQVATNGNGVPLPASDGTAFGSVFRVDPSGKLSTLYSFSGGKDGANYAPGTGTSSARSSPKIVITEPMPTSGTCAPTATVMCPVVVSLSNNYNVPKALVEAADGTFYGTAKPVVYNDGQTEEIDGSLFNITPAGAFTTLYTFSNPTAPGSDGGGSYFGLNFGGDGNLYGVSGNVVFNFTPVSGSSSVVPNPLYTFTGGADGSLPQFLLATSSGTFAGTTYGNTSTNTVCTSCGTVFSLAPSAPVPAPVLVSILPRSAGLLFAPLLTWFVPNAYSLTARQCYAFQFGGAGGGAWTGKQTGTLMGNLYTGSVAIEPTAAGTYTYSLTCGGTVSGSATLTVPPLSITTTSLAIGYTGAPYTATLAAGGVAPYFWKVVGGALPAGLTLSIGTGVISGTPTGSGTSFFTVQVSAPDVTSVTASVNLSITIAAPTLMLTPPALTVVRGSSQSATIVFSGFATNSISLSCVYLPAYATCSFGPLVGTGISGSQTLSIATPLFVALDHRGRPVSPNNKAGEVSVAALFSLGLLLGLRRRRGVVTFLCLLILSIAMVTLTSCYGGGLHNVVPAGSYTVNINASAGTQNVTAPLQLTVQ
jgi:uncharacterized repeat protein (TIGR03803 family)